jgi:hypothetical protein
MQSLTELLIKQQKAGKLAPFYIIRPPLMDPEFDLNLWSKDYLSIILSQHYQTTSDRALEKLEHGHNDILIIEKDESKKAYHVEHEGLSELVRMQSYKPSELAHQYILIMNAELITDIIANKLLKILEEPRSHQSIFFLCQGHRPLMKTIQSRAITLHHPYVKARKAVKDKKSLPPILDYLKSYFEEHEQKVPTQVIDAFASQSYHIIIDHFAKNKELTQHLMNALSHYHTHPLLAAAFKIHWQSELARYERSQTFHNYASQRVFSLAHMTHSIHTNTLRHP